VKYKQYPSYKESKVEWLGEIPEHWEVRKLKYVLHERNIRSKTGEETLLSLSKYYGVIPKNSLKEKANNAESLVGYKEVRVDDLVINKMQAVNGLIDVSLLKGITSPDYSVYKLLSKNNNIRYINHLLNEPSYLAEYKKVVTGVMEGYIRLYTDDLYNIDALLPPKSIQIEIVNYLDKATAKIDTLIEKQTKLIELLKEKRQAMVDEISNGANVTKMRLGRVTNQMLRPVSRKARIQYEALGLYNRGRGLFHKPKKSEDELGDSDFYWVEEQDLILSGQFAWEGSVALASASENNCIVSHRYPVIRGKDGILDTEYLWAYFTTREGDFLLNEHSIGSAGRNRPLNINTLMKDSIPVPKFEYQLKVARIVQSEKLIMVAINKAIDLLKEKRTALISAAVTGKIDVRDAA